MTTILIIEDEAAIRELISELLILEGLDVAEAVNGREGIAIAQSVLPDLIICDVMMPEIDGHGVLQTLQKNPQTVTIPFIFLTAKGTRQDVRYAMNLGADDYLIKPFANDELLEVIQIRLKKKEIINQQYIEKLEENKEKISHLLYHDLLTNLPNQLSLRENFERLIAPHKNQSNNLSSDEENPSLSENSTDFYGICLIILSFERFSRINDHLGYEGGNQLLKEAVDRIQATVGQPGAITRLNSNEFVIVLTPSELSNLPSNPSVTNLKDNSIQFSKILVDAFSSPFFTHTQEIICPIILGIALYPLHGANLDQLLQCARKAKDSIKNQGGNLYQFYHPSLEKNTSVNVLDLERDLRHALERNEFVVYYQPQINAHTRQIVCAEALVRWDHPKKGRISPYIFIPIAEATGLIQGIGEWVLEKSCEQLKSWHKLGLDSIRIAVNLSARQFNQANLGQWLTDLFQKHGVNPSQIELELTESTLVDDIPRSIEQLHQLKSVGIKVAMDDFGTGYSSLSYLQQFPFDILKIDQCFIQKIDQNPKNAAIAQAIITMAHQLNLRVVAEGVETTEELTFVHENNCDEIQGYLFSEPITSEEFTQLLQTENPFSF
ncbi:MAG: GGDEF domain-containing response regulator [Snowella sp.]|nr:MAG: GGDEF domain-containing response regulator [Snowella sp.]